MTDDFKYRKKPKIEAKWRELNKTQKLVRLGTYSIISFLCLLGIFLCIIKFFVLGIFCILLSFTGFYIIKNLPYWYMLKYYRKAELEFQKHKNDDNKNTIYLTGNQMRHLFEDGAVDLGKSMPPIIFNEVFKENGNTTNS